MKLDRLLGILTVLLQREKVTAPYLAQKFEVSRRTINRDIDDICKAGIPVVTRQGGNGGISIADGYKIDKTIFTQEELRAVLTGLSCLDSVAQDKKYENIMEKLSPQKSAVLAPQHILIDLSSHYKGSLAPKISALQAAIDALHTVSFSYCSRSGERLVLLDPYLVVFRWSDWYVLGRDHQHGDFRLFKLNRLWGLKTSPENYAPQQIPAAALAFDEYFIGDISAVVLFAPGAKHRIIDEYGNDSFTLLPDGRLRFSFSFKDKDYLLAWVMSFGELAELVQPPDLRDELRCRLEKTLLHYV